MQICDRKSIMSSCPKLERYTAWLDPAYDDALVGYVASAGDGHQCYLPAYDLSKIRKIVAADCMLKGKTSIRDIYWETVKAVIVRGNTVANILQPLIINPGKFSDPKIVGMGQSGTHMGVVYKADALTDEELNESSWILNIPN